MRGALLLALSLVRPAPAGPFLFEGQVPAVPASAPVASAYASPSLPAPEPLHTLVARVPLGGLDDYLYTSLTFDDGGRTVHVSGSKDPWQKRGYYMALTVRGEPTVWVKPTVRKQPFAFRGRTYYIDVGLGFLLKNALLNPDRVTVELTRGGDPSFKKRFTAGELSSTVARRGRPFAMLGRTFYAGTYPIRNETQGEWRELPGMTGVLLLAWDTYSYDGDKTGYRFENYHFDHGSLRRGLQVRDMQRWVRTAGGVVKVVYAFRIDAQGWLEVYDLSQDPSPGR